MNPNLCPRCSQPVPEAALYCPTCTSREGSQEKALMKGGFRGALLGLLAGLIPAGLLYFTLGPERGTKAIIFLLPSVGLSTGLVLGLARARRPVQHASDMEMK